MHAVGAHARVRRLKSWRAGVRGCGGSHAGRGLWHCGWGFTAVCMWLMHTHIRAQVASLLAWCLRVQSDRQAFNLTRLWDHVADSRRHDWDTVSCGHMHGRVSCSSRSVRRQIWRVVRDNCWLHASRSISGAGHTAAGHACLGDHSCVGWMRQWRQDSIDTRPRTAESAHLDRRATFRSLHAAGVMGDTPSLLCGMRRCCAVLLVRCFRRWTAAALGPAVRAAYRC